jgi:hypothetical protein
MLSLNNLIGQLFPKRSTWKYYDLIKASTLSVYFAAPSINYDERNGSRRPDKPSRFNIAQTESTPE